MTTILLRRSNRNGWKGHSFRRPSWRGSIEGFVCVTLLCCACDFLLPVRIGLALSGILYGCWSVFLGVREARSTVLHVNPLVTYQMWQAATLGLSPLYVALKYPASEGVPFAVRFVLPSQVAYGHAILVVGAFALYLGMKHFQPKEAIPGSGGMQGSSGWELLTYFVAGMAILIFVYRITALLGSTLASLSSMPLAALSLFATTPPAGLRRPRWAYWAVLMGGTAILLWLNARGDSKMMLSFSFIPLAIASLRRKRVGLPIALGIGFAALYILVISPLVWNIRIAVQGDERGVKSVLDPNVSGNVRGQMEWDFRNDPLHYLSTWVDRTMLRVSDPVAAGIVAEYADNGGLLLGAGMDYVPMAFIPRMFWRDKPVIERGRYFTAILGQASDESTATSSAGQTSAGELFWNFGWPGVIIGMYLLGAAFSGAWWAADGGDPTNGVLEMTAFLGITLSFVMGVGSAAGGEFVTAISSGIVLRALIRVRGWVSPRSRGHARGVVAAAPQMARCR